MAVLAAKRPVRKLITLGAVMALLLIQAIAPHTALADASWIDTGGPMLGAQIVSLAYNPGHNLLYAAGGSNEVWKYDGTSWTSTGVVESSISYINCLAYDANHNILYAGVLFPSGIGVWKYDGTSWTGTGGEVAKYGVESLAYDPYHNLLYAGTGGWGVWKYDGTSWTDTGGGLPSCGVWSLACDPYHNLLYAGTSGIGVWKYDGTSWTDTGRRGVTYDAVSSLAYDAKHDLLYAGSADKTPYPEKGNGVWKYDGTSWTNTGGAVANQFIGSLAYDPNHNLLYAGIGGVGVWRYDGISWTNIGVEMSTYGVGPLAYDSTHNVLYAGATGVWKYTPQLTSSFYFAEGYTGPNFAEYLCLGNPNGSAAAAQVTYMFSNGTTKDASYQVPANSRMTVNVNNEVGPNQEVSIRVLSETPNLVAERPMYFNYDGAWTGGHDAVGATAPANRWYFAEGTTLPYFDEYVTVLNPGDTAANLTFSYMVEGSGEQVCSGQVGAHSRATFKTRDQIGDGKNASLMLDSNQNVVAERPMYFDYKAGIQGHGWTGGHDVVGTTAPAKAWYLAEGTTRGGFEEWLCLQNPGDSPITVNARYLLGPGQGDPISKTYDVPAKQRRTISVNAEIGPDKDDSLELTSDANFIAERPMYFNYHDIWTGGHDVLGAKNSATTCFLAEGYTGANFNEWLCLQNPSGEAAGVTITYYPTSGTPISKPWTIAPNSRLTVNVNTDAGPNLEISAKVESNKPIIAERPMYFNYNGVWTGGHDVVGMPSE